MSVPLSYVDLSSATTGATGKIPLTAAGITADPSLIGRSPAQLRFYNESGCGLRLTFKTSGSSCDLPAGGWTTLPLVPGESEVDYTVLYVLSNAQVNLLLTTYYAPGEPVPSVATLGNSPIGGTVLSTTVQQVINSGNPTRTIVVQGTPSTSGDPETQLFNDGSLYLGGVTNTDDNGIVQLNLYKTFLSATPPTGTGSITIYQIAGATPYQIGAGTFYKKLILVFSNLKNTSASTYTIALPASMKCLQGWFIHASDCPNIEFLSGGVAQGMNVANGFGTTASGTVMSKWTWASGLGVFDTLRFQASDTLTHNGFTILEYI